MGLTIGNYIGIGKNSGISLSQYWTKQTDLFLFFGQTSKISSGQLKNEMSGSSDFLTVAGVAGSETYQCPNTAAYLAADTDYIWQDQLGILRTVTTAELTGYDFSRTLVWYESDSPYAIKVIAILKPGQSVTDEMRDTFLLSYWWDGTLSAHGAIKNNRTLGKSYWHLTLLKDTHTKFWYKMSGSDIWTISGKDGAYYDKMYGSSNWSAEIATGSTVIYSIYKITATQANYFYTGCQVGDVFICATAKALGASNKVQLLNGNHLTQHAAAKRPTGGVFVAASTTFMKTAPFTWNQPEMVYAVMKQAAWGGVMWDGNAVQAGYFASVTSTPRVGIVAGNSPVYNDAMTVDQYFVVRAYYNRTSSFLKIGTTEDSLSLDIGTNNMGGFTLGAMGNGALSFSTITVSEIIGRDQLDDSETENAFYNYLKNAYGL